MLMPLQQELIHATTITGVLSSNRRPSISPCSYSFPYTDPGSFVSLANMVTR